MNQERLILRGKLEELKHKKTELVLTINGNINAIKNMLALSGFSPIAEIDLEGIHSLAAHADTLKKEYIQVAADIEKINRELD